MTIAGCYLKSGKAYHDSFRINHTRRPRDTGIQCHIVKKVKDNVKEVKEGYECGIVVDNYPEPKEGDVMVFFEDVQKVRNI